MGWWKRASKGSYYFRGPNPAVDLVAVRKKNSGDEILLIRRAEGATEGGKWALPGGFINTDAKKGEEWREGRETPRAAAVRETLEETGVSVDPSSLVEIGVFEGGGRDPRDSEEAWSKSYAFGALVEGDTRAAGGDDASDARWFSVREIPPTAFDHHKIISAGLRALGIG